MIPLTSRHDGREWRGRVRDIQARALSIDGTDLASLKCWLTDARLGDAPPSTAFVDAPGRAGGIDLTLDGPTGAASPARRACEFDIMTDCASHERACVRFALGAYAGRTVEVLFAPLRAALRGRLSVGAWEDSAAVSACTLILDAEPFALGERRSSSAGRLTVEGSAWAVPSFELTVRDPRPSIDLVLDGARVMRVPSAGGAWPRGARLVIDCAERSIRANGNLAAPTLDSDWPVLTPGAHTVACEGCGLRTSWRERYMF